MLGVSRAETVRDRAIEFIEPPSAVLDVASIPRTTKSAPASDREFRELIGILRRRFRLVAAIAMAGPIIAAIVGLTISPRYIATAQIMVERPLGNERPVRPGEMDETIDTHLTLLKSRDHLQRVIDSLMKDFEAPPATSPAAQPEIDAGASSSGSDKPASLSNTAPSIVDVVKQRFSIWVAALWSASGGAVPNIDEFERNTKVLQERRSRIISVGYISTSPEKAAAFVNRLVQLYVDNLSEQRQASADAELARLRDRIVEAKSEMDSTGLAVQRAMQERLSGEQDSSVPGNEADRQLQILQREASASAQLYGSLLRRQKEMRVQQEADSVGLSVNSLASVPDRPSSHNPILFIVPAFFIFAICGGWIAVVLDKLDRGLRSEKATAEALGIPCIGFVPHIPLKSALQSYQQFRKEPFSEYSEALRSAVATLQLVDPGSLCKVILVTSSVSGEGKTSLALGLAGYVAGFGRRVLLIDLDLRSRSKPPEMSAGLETEVIDPSLQNRALTEVLRRLPEGGPHCLSIAHHHLDPLAPFANDRIPRLVQKQRQQYDCVIIDGPPVLAAAEARLLCPTVDRVLYAVKWGETKQEVVQNALGLLRDSGSLDKQRKDFTVAILTQVKQKDHIRCWYGHVEKYLGRYILRRQSISS
jgi:polysaccharide biosynthesis transport protein